MCVCVYVCMCVCVYVCMCVCVYVYVCITYIYGWYLYLCRLALCVNVHLYVCVNENRTKTQDTLTLRHGAQECSGVRRRGGENVVVTVRFFLDSANDLNSIVVAVAVVLEIGVGVDVLNTLLNTRGSRGRVGTLVLDAPQLSSKRHSMRGSGLEVVNKGGW